MDQIPIACARNRRPRTGRGLAAERRGGPEVQGGDGQEVGQGRREDRWCGAGGSGGRGEEKRHREAPSPVAPTPSHADRRRSSPVPSTLRFRGGRLAGVLRWLSFPFRCFHGDRRMGKIKFQLLLQ